MEGLNSWSVLPTPLMGQTGVINWRILHFWLSYPKIIIFHIIVIAFIALECIKRYWRF